MPRIRPILPIAAISLLIACQSQSRVHERAEKAEQAPSPSTPAADVVPAAPAVQLDPARGSDIGLSFEAYLSPHQEPAEEADTPRGTPKMFRSTAPSQDRNARAAAGHRGHGKVRFTEDLSRAYVDVKIEGIDLESINMFHIHCGKPGILGPILVDFAVGTDIGKNFESGVFSVVVTNEDIDKTAHHGHGPVAAFTAGCVIPSPSLGGLKPSKISTVAGMARMAQDGELYFNLHTKGQTYYGDIRGQLSPAR